MAQTEVKPEVAARRKYPEPVVIVTTRSADGMPNAMAVGWIAVASGDPMMYVLGIDDESYTFGLIKETKQFVVAFPSENMSREVLYVGKQHGRGRDKMAECGLASQPASVVRAPLVADAVANFECELVDIFKPGDCPLVVGKVVAAHVNTNEKIKRLYTVGSGHKLGRVRVVE